MFVLTQACPGEYLIKTMHESGFSRIPVYLNSPDKICGIIRPFDLINVDKKKPVNKYAAQPLVMNQFTPILRVLLELQVNARQMVILEDNNKKTVGIITMEDIMKKLSEVLPMNTI